MKKNWSISVVLVLSCFILTGCSSDDQQASEEPVVVPTTEKTATDKPDSEEPSQGEVDYILLTLEQHQLVADNNDFAFRLFRQLHQDDNAKSFIVSPLSITYALGMLNNGAAGQTQQQINSTLGFGSTGAEGINVFCQKMLKEAPLLDKETKVMLANTIFFNKDYTLLPAFTDIAQEFYAATPETRDFADGKTLDVINQWASDHTEQMIDRILSADEFSPNAVSYLLNAIYFKGSWSAKFDKADTRQETFGDQGKSLPIMHQEEMFNYVDNELCQALRLPYGNGAYALTVLLPKEGKTPEDVLQSLSSSTWRKYQLMAGTAIVDVKLPRFESETHVNLRDVMTALGMSDAFDSEKADFSTFCNVPTYIQLMKQVAKVRLDEQGSEAAAVTVNVGYTDSYDDTPHEVSHVNFHATRPFLYIISEKSTGAIFFVGQFYGE